MSAHYSRIPTQDPDSFVADYSSPFTYDFQKNGKIDASKYRSAFSYRGDIHISQMHSDDATIVPSGLCKLCGYLITFLSYLLVIITCPLSALCTLKRVKNHQKLVVFRLGRLLATRDPGTALVLPCIDQWYPVDLRTKAFSVPPQKIMTIDNAALEVGCDVYYHIRDAVLSVYNVKDLNHSTRMIAQTALQKHFAKHCLSDLQTNKAIIMEDLKEDVNKMTLTWGVQVERFDMSEIKIISKPNLGPAANPLNLLGPMLFPSGQQSMPLEQMQQELLKQMGHQGNKIHPVPQVQSEAFVNQSTKRPESQIQDEPKFKTADDLINAIQPYLNSDMVAEFGSTYQFNLTGENGGKYYLDVKNGTGSAQHGALPGGDADVTLTMSTSDMGLVLMEQLSIFSAYMSGRLDVKGDIQKARKLGDLVAIIREKGST